MYSRGVYSSEDGHSKFPDAWISKDIFLILDEEMSKNENVLLMSWNLNPLPMRQILLKMISKGS